MNSRILSPKLIFLLASLLAAAGCKEWYPLPEDLDYLSGKANYTQKVFTPVLGRTTLYTNIFNADNSTIPMTFSIENVRLRDGTPSSDLEQVHPVLVWTQAYTGEETSLEEIESKRKLEDRKLWEVREKSGELALMSSAGSELVRHQPDSGYLFDVRFFNSGGERVIEDLELIPFRERPYEPSDKDPITGIQRKVWDPNIGDSLWYYVHPIVSGITGVETDLPLESEDVRVYFRRTGDGNTLRFRFLDTDSASINPALFDITRWDKLLHGFNRQMTDEYVQYDVAYPVPLIRMPTHYTTSDGSQAHVEFEYDRRGFGGFTEVGTLSLNFNIFQKGDWEIVFHFFYDDPKFQDE